MQAVTDEEDIDALALISEDHRHVERLFARFEAPPQPPAEARLRERLARQIGLLLTVHAAVEAELFYPAAFDALEDGPFVADALADHRRMQELIQQLQALEVGAPAFEAGMARLRALFDAHVRQEEGALFSRLSFTSLDRLGLGRRMLARRDQLLQRAYAGD